MTDQTEAFQVKFAVEKNEKYGDHRVVEYFDCEWNNERDNNWSKEKANQVKEGLELALVRLNGDMIVPKRVDTAIYIN